MCFANTINGKWTGIHIVLFTTSLIQSYIRKHLVQHYTNTHTDAFECDCVNACVDMQTRVARDRTIDPTHSTSSARAASNKGPASSTLF